MRQSLLFATVLALAGAPAAHAQVVTIGNGVSLSAVHPINHGEAFSVCESIYLQPQINQSGQITHLALEKSSGTNLAPLNNVYIYLKTTTATAFSAGAFDTTGYQRVYQGSFPNGATSGYQEVTLRQPFAYDNADNLAVLVVRRNGTTDNVLASRARWRYTIITGRNSVRRAYGATFPAALNDLSVFLPNVRLTFSATTAAAGPRQVTLGGPYPNPATDQLFVPAEQSVTIRITDLRGRPVRPAATLSPVDGRLALAVADLPAGVYVLHQQRADGSTAAQRFVRE